jgi:hypothetical protein
MQKDSVLDFYPKSGLDLLNAGGRHLVEKLGIEAVREVVLAVMKGENLRSRTELLTRRRIALSSGALLMFFINGIRNNPAFVQELPERAIALLKSQTLTKQEKWVINWLLGLTDKAVQNVLRDDVEGSSDYHDSYSLALRDSAAKLATEFGPIGGVFETGPVGTRNKVQIDWLFILNLLGATGMQAMTIRGSDKSTYGKLFERLILGSLLHILGFSLIDGRASDHKLRMVYWLSERKDKRESDATALIKVGKGVRFDIGFIGRGNSEISLDKVSRFEREAEFGRVHYTMGTFVIVDKIGARSRLPVLAANIQGTIVQMSMSYWPKHVARELAKIEGFSHPLCDMRSEAAVDRYLTDAIARVPMADLLPSHFELASNEEEDE